MPNGLLIAGASVNARNAATVERLDPMTGAVATISAAASCADVREAADAALAALTEWSTMSPEGRRSVLLRAADLMTDHIDDFTHLMLTEAGATAGWARFNVTLAASMLREAAAMTTQISGQVIPSNKPGTLALAVRQPVGVCAAIAPWNAPVILGTRAVAMPLACGNTVVLKASEQTPGTHLLIGQILVDAGLPDGAINVITNDPVDGPEIVAELIGHPAVRHVNFTGSSAVGRIVAQHAATHLKPVLLELGGKAPLVVLADADIDAAVNAAAFGCFMNQGQICMSTERLVVVDDVADEFVHKLAAKASALPAGDPRGPVVLGSMIGAGAADRMVDLIADATAKGAVVVAGGGRSGTVIDATLIDHVTPGMRIYAEESFGPVKPVIRVADDDEAVTVANDTEYGLSAAVFSRDITRALKIAARIDSGICHINGPTVGDEAQMPFGGTKSSGFGRFGGQAAVDAFTNLRWITIEDPGQHYPF